MTSLVKSNLYVFVWHTFEKKERKKTVILTILFYVMSKIIELIGLMETIALFLFVHLLTMWKVKLLEAVNRVLHMLYGGCCCFFFVFFYVPNDIIMFG